MARGLQTEDILYGSLRRSPADPLKKLFENAGIDPETLGTIHGFFEEHHGWSGGATWAARADRLPTPFLPNYASELRWNKNMAQMPTMLHRFFKYLSYGDAADKPWFPSTPVECVDNGDGSMSVYKTIAGRRQEPRIMTDVISAHINAIMILTDPVNGEWSLSKNGVLYYFVNPTGVDAGYATEPVGVSF